MSQRNPPPVPPPPPPGDPANWRSEPDYRDSLPPAPPLLGSYDTARLVLWICFGAWAGLMLLLHLAALKAQSSAVQQAAVSADSAAWLVGGYCIMRSINAAILASQGR